MAWKTAAAKTLLPVLLYSQTMITRDDTVIKLHQAATAVQNDLRRQSIVWLEGRYLPQDIVLVDAGDGVEIAR